MSGITLEIAKAKRDECLSALAQARSSQSAERNGKRQQRGDHASILRELQYWERLCIRLGNASRMAVVEVIPR